jgi:GTP-binding protein
LAIPTVAVVGRVNVGKSAFFNRLVGRRNAIVDDAPGVTRDRNMDTCVWGGRTFFVVDTGGLAPGTEDPLQESIERQVRLAVEDADAVVLVTDVTQGAHPFDQTAADLVRRSGLPFFLVVNKVDNSRREELVVDFYSLGLGDPWPVSSLHGRGVGDLLDALVESLPPEEDEPSESRKELDLAVVGRPNVGKSSIVNRLCGSERCLVTPEAGTTRDSTDTVLEHDGRLIRLVDTAGLRRRSRRMEDVEYYSTVRAWRSMSVSDVVLVVLDGAEYPTQQDLRIAGKAWDLGKGLVFGVNKADLGLDRGLWREAVRERFAPARWIPVIFHSALTGRGMDRVIPTVVEVGDRRRAEIPTSTVNRRLREAVERVQPPAPRGRPVRFFYATQVGSRPPKLLVFVNRPGDIPENYRRYVENSLREVLEMDGVPLRVLYRARKH